MRWPWQRAATEAQIRTIMRRLDNLEDELEHVGYRIRRLRGQVFGGTRPNAVLDQLEPEPVPEPETLELVPEGDAFDHALGAQQRFGKG